MRHGGFTLIELLIVVAIVATLTGMAMPLVTLAARGAKKATTQGILRKIDIAVHLFKNDAKVFPYQAEDQALSAEDDLMAGRSNNLYLRLGGDMDQTRRTDLDDDLAAIDLRFAYDLKNHGSPSSSLSESYNVIPVTAFKAVDIVPRGWTQWNPTTRRLEIPKTAIIGTGSALGSAIYLNRLAKERFRLAVLSGNVQVGGWKAPTVYDPAGSYPTEFPGGERSGRDLSGIQLVANPKSVGWCGDYLAGDMERRFIAGGTILDAYGNPVLYCCPVVPGVATSVSWSHGGWQGSNQQMREVDYGLDAEGRRSRDRLDIRHSTGFDYADPADPASSDRRYFTAPGLELEPELWSAGADGLLCGQRGAAMNRDDVSAVAYDRNLLP